MKTELATTTELREINQALEQAIRGQINELRQAIASLVVDRRGPLSEAVVLPFGEKNLMDLRMGASLILVDDAANVLAQREFHCLNQVIGVLIQADNCFTAGKNLLQLAQELLNAHLITG